MEGPAPDDSCRQPTILAVDDDPQALCLLREVLSSQGYAVVIAPGGLEGIDLFLAARSQGSAFDLVITDLEMPDLTGLDVAERVKAESPGTPVMLVSGNGQEILADARRRSKFDEIFSKPVRVLDLLNGVRRIMSGASCHLQGHSA